MLRGRLRPGGVLAQWFHGYEMSVDLQAALLETVGASFSWVSAWTLFPGDLLLLACDQACNPAPARLARWWATPSLRRDLERLDVAGVDGVLSMRAASAPAFAAVFQRPPPARMPLLDDDLPALELGAPLALWRGERADLIADADERSAHEPGLTPDVIAYDESGRNIPVPPVWPLRDDAQSVALAKALLRQHSRFPSAPAAFRHRLAAWLLPRADAGFLTDLLWTLLRETQQGAETLRAGERSTRALTRLEARTLAAQVARRLEALAPDQPAALLTRALAARLLADRGELVIAEVALLRRCVALGDEPGARCARLLEAALGARPALAARLVR